MHYRYLITHIAYKSNVLYTSRILGEFYCVNLLLTLLLGFDAIVLFNNDDINTYDVNYIMTKDGKLDFHWANRASAARVTGLMHK